MDENLMAGDAKDPKTRFLVVDCLKDVGLQEMAFVFEGSRQVSMGDYLWKALLHYSSN
jgi:hypothetical protein